MNGTVVVLKSSNYAFEMNFKENHIITFLAFVAIFLVQQSCKKKTETTAESRSFYMGTTSWPADFTTAEVDSAYSFVNNNCDIISHHFDDGIPYDEAFNNSLMPSALIQEVAVKKAKTSSAIKVFLSVSALGLSRNEKAPYYSRANVTDSIKNYWKQLPFDHPKLITTYVNYISWLIDELHPIYVNYGVESNVLNWDAANFLHYKNFIAQVFPLLKTKYPNIPFFVSYIVDESAEGFNYASQLMPYTDFVGLSSYPYITVSSSNNGNTNPKEFPVNYYERFANLSTTKPLVFAETGYIAEDLIVPSYNLNKRGNVQWQKEYIEMIFNFANKYNAKMVIWFCGKDYDAGNNTLRSLGLYQDLFALWEDTGLKDENGNKRPSYILWDNWQKRKLK